MKFLTLRWTLIAGVMALTSGCKRHADHPTAASATIPQSGSPKSDRDSRNLGGDAGIFFRDITAKTQIQFAYQNDESHSDFAILESLGGGVGIFDFDGDTNLDVLFPGGGQFVDRTTRGIESGLFRNMSSMQFLDVSVDAGISHSPFYSHGTSIADFDEDGFSDVLLTGYGGLTLYQNQGDGTFQLANQSGLDDRLWSSSAAWADLTGDGVLDLYVAHYVDWSFDKNPVCEGTVKHPRDVCPPRQFQGLPHTIYLGNGDGTFRDGTAECGIQPVSKGLGVVVADLDLDKDLDIYVANDTVFNLQFRNDGHGHFEDVSLTSGTAFSDQGTPDGSMGVDVGDFNADGLPDIWVTNYERENNALYRNLGKGLFRHVSQTTGIAAIGAMYVGWGTRFLDADLDGDEDLIVTNGHVIRFPQNTPRLQTPLMLQNEGGTRFTNVSARAGDYIASPHCGRGLATGDLDNDGDEDVVISHVNQPVSVLLNESAPIGNWISLRLIGRSSSRSAIGTFALAQVGPRRLLRQIRGGSSFASTSDLKLHFGMGQEKQIDELTVFWLSGRKSVLKNVPHGETVTVIEPAEAAE